MTTTTSVRQLTGKKILVVAPFSLVHTGGAATVVRALVDGYRAAGCEVTVAAPAGGDRPLALAAGSQPVWTRQWRDVRTRGAGRTLRALAADVAADAVHVHNFAAGLSAAAVGELACERRTILTLHDHYALCHRGGLVRPGAVLCPGPGARCLVCPGRQGRRELHRPRRLQAIRRHLSPPLTIVSPSRDGRDLLAACGYPNVIAVPNGVDLSTFHPPRQPRSFAPDGRLELIAAGRAARVKGVRIATRATEILAARLERPVRLRWVGPRAAAAAARVGSPVCEGLDAVPHAQLAALYREADIAVVPSLARETFGLAAAEAMACGLPVVASDRGALPEVLGDTGLIVPAGDAEALAVALLRLAESDELRQDLGARAATRAATLYNWPDVARCYLGLLLGSV